MTTDVDPDTGRDRAARPGRPIILFDGVCNLCAGSVKFVLARDPDERFLFASLQSRPAQALLTDLAPELRHLDSIVLVQDGRAHDRSTAALRIARGLRGGWPLLYGFIVVPKPVRDWVYGVIARNRYRWFGKSDTCMIPAPGVRDRFLDADEPAVASRG